MNRVTVVSHSSSRARARGLSVYSTCRSSRRRISAISFGSESGKQLDHLLVADPFEAAAGCPAFAALVEDVGDAAGHARGEVAAGLADDHDLAAGHVFAAVIADTLNHSAGAGVADSEALTGHAADVGLAGRSTV